MKKFKISFELETYDDDWQVRKVEEMMNTVLDPIYHLRDSCVNELNTKEIEVEQ